MHVAVTARHRRRFLALIQLVLFAFSASTSLLPCASAMPTTATERSTVAHHATSAHSSHDSHDAPKSASTESHAPSHHTPTSPTSSAGCAWVVGCTGLVQLAFESSWRVIETTPVASVPVGVTLRAVTAERDVESPPPRA